jgi:hypothetical protein
MANDRFAPEAAIADKSGLNPTSMASAKSRQPRKAARHALRVLTSTDLAPR